MGLKTSIILIIIGAAGTINLIEVVWVVKFAGMRLVLLCIILILELNTSSLKRYIKAVGTKAPNIKSR